MKIVLLTLSGNPDLALEYLAAHFRRRRLSILAERRFEKDSILAHLNQPLGGDNLRYLLSRPNDLFGNVDRITFLLLGALAGARQSIIVDAHGGTREESRAKSYSMRQRESRAKLH